MVLFSVSVEGIHPVSKHTNADSSEALTHLHHQARACWTWVHWAPCRHSGEPSLFPPRGQRWRTAAASRRTAGRTAAWCRPLSACRRKTECFPSHWTWNKFALTVTPGRCSALSGSIAQRYHSRMSQLLSSNTRAVWRLDVLLEDISIRKTASTTCSFLDLSSIFHQKTEPENYKKQ